MNLEAAIQASRAGSSDSGITDYLLAIKELCEDLKSGKGGALDAYRRNIASKIEDPQNRPERGNK